MNRLTDNDRNWGPFTFARWKGHISAYIQSRGEDDEGSAYILLAAFGWALRMRLWNWIIRPWREKWIECNWDAETVKRLGRTGYWVIHPRRFGFSLSDMRNGYDFFQVYYGPHTMDSSTDRSWSKHLPWKQWRCVRHSTYLPNGQHWHTDPCERGSFQKHWEIMRGCPKIHFEIEDFDGERIIASCNIEEWEWYRGEGWFKWLRWFYPKKIRRAIDIQFNSEVGPEKGSWKGGTTGHGMDMKEGETLRQTFERYCETNTFGKGRKQHIKFIGPCDAPPPKPEPKPADDAGER